MVQNHEIQLPKPSTQNFNVLKQSLRRSAYFATKGFFSKLPDNKLSYVWGITNPVVSRYIITCQRNAGKHRRLSKLTYTCYAVEAEYTR